MVVDANHPAVPGGLRLTYDPNGDNAYDGFDRFGRVLDANWVRTAGAAVDRFGYTYDRASNRLTRSLPLKPDYNETYQYDHLDRLRDANRPGDANGGQLDQSWTLRPTGNWESFTSGGVEQTRTHNNANEILTITADPNDPPDPLYGLAGCNVYGPKPNDDANGMHQRYDAWNRLATVHWDDGDTAGTLDANDTQRATYRYDGLNRRVRKVVVGDDANTTTEHIYHNTKWQVLEVRRGVNEAPTATAYKQYAYDIRYIDAPVCRWWDADTDGQMEPTAGEMHYYTNDAQFNATALIDANSGSVVERYMYDPYGKVTVLNGTDDADANTADWTPDGDNRSDYENDILYCGYRHDPETELYHVRHRYLNWLTGTWGSRDKIGYVDGANLYEYVRSGPIGYTDPMGQAVGVPVGKGPKYADGGSYVYTGVMLKATDDETTKIVNGGGGYIISTLDVRWVIKDCNEEGDSGVMKDTASKTWTSQVNVANGAIDVDRKTYYNRNVTVRSGGAHGYYILDEKAKAGDQKTALEYTVLLNYDLTEKNGYSKLTCTKGYIMASWDYTVYVGGNADYQNAMKTVKPYPVSVETDNPAKLVMPWDYDGIEYTDYCHKPTCHTEKVATPHQGAVQVTKGSVTVRYSWDRCTANTKLFAEMTGIELATGTVIRPGRGAEVNKGTPMTLNVNQGNLARWQDELGG